MASPEYAVEVRGVTKRFRRSTVRGGYTTLKTQLVGLVTGKRREVFERQNIEVLRGVDLLVPKGKTVGIIGENGSGKSTLLKILTGIYTPTTGSVTVRGRISALLELGAGFHPDFSGRENIFVNGIILGLSRSEVKARLDEIIEFSELGDFIDEPVRTYSSGMGMRLAFSVATFVDPEVLIIDEILAVGDEHFARKSRAKMDEFKAKGKTIVLVTHDLGAVRTWCDEAAWLDEGRIAAWGDPAETVALYRNRVADKEARGAAEGAGPQTPAKLPAARLVAMRLLTRPGAAQELGPESSASFELDFATEAEAALSGFSVDLVRADGLHLFGTTTAATHFELPSPLPRSGSVRFTLDRVGLADGSYTLHGCPLGPRGERLEAGKAAVAFSVRTSSGEQGVLRPTHHWEFTGAGRGAAGAPPRVFTA